MPYDRSTRDYRGGPPQPPTDFAEDDGAARGESTSGRIILAPPAAFVSRPAAQLRSLTRWSADEPSPVALLVSVVTSSTNAREAGVFAHAQGASGPDDPAPIPSSLAANGPAAPTAAAKAYGVVYFAGQHYSGDGLPTNGFTAQLPISEEQTLTFNLTPTEVIDAPNGCYLRCVVEEEGEIGNALVNTTPVAVTTPGNGLSGSGIVVGESGSMVYNPGGPGDTGYGIVRFDGQVTFSGDPYAPGWNLGNTDGSAPYTFYVLDEDGTTRIPIHQVSALQIPPYVAFVNSDNGAHVYTTLGGGIAGASGTYKNLPNGTPVYVVPVEEHDAGAGVNALTNGVIVGGPDDIGTFGIDEGGFATGMNGAGWGYGFDAAAAGMYFSPVGSGFTGGANGSPGGSGGVPGGVLVITYGAGDVRRTLELDLRSGSYQLPPCTSIDVGALLWGLWPNDALPLAVAAACVPGIVPQPSAMLNSSSPRFEPDAGQVATFDVPTGAVAVRILGGVDVPNNGPFGGYQLWTSKGGTLDVAGVSGRFTGYNDLNQAARQYPDEWRALTGAPARLHLAAASNASAFTVQFLVEP